MTDPHTVTPALRESHEPPFRLYAQGHEAAAVAGELFLSQATVRTHLKNIKLANDDLPVEVLSAGYLLNMADHEAPGAIITPDTAAEVYRHMTPSTRRVAWLFAQGFSHGQTAEIGHVSKSTIKSHTEYGYDALRARDIPASRRSLGAVAALAGAREEFGVHDAPKPNGRSAVQRLPHQRGASPIPSQRSTLHPPKVSSQAVLGAQ